MKSKVVKKKQVVIGNNVRFDPTIYNSLKNYCEMRGYKIGKFCESGAMEKMKAEIELNNSILANLSN